MPSSGEAVLLDDHEDGTFCPVIKNIYPDDPYSSAAGWIYGVGQQPFIYQVSAYILGKDPQVWPPDLYPEDVTGDSSARIVINHNSLWGSVSLGYVKGYFPWGIQRHTFVFYTGIQFPLFEKWLFPPQPLLSFTKYEIRTNGDTAQFFFNGGNIWGPQQIYFYPEEAQMYGQTNALSSQMPGGSGSPEVFQLVTVNNGTQPSGWGIEVTDPIRHWAYDHPAGWQEQLWIADLICY